MCVSIAIAAIPGAVRQCLLTVCEKGGAGASDRPRRASRVLGSRTVAVGDKVTQMQIWRIEPMRPDVRRICMTCVQI
jgi:hypothetical protein